MNLITVIPITRAKFADSLSYFTASDIPVGAIVNVPLRTKTVTAIVTETKPIEDVKSELRGADFQIRKLGKVKANSFFPTTFISACKELADYYATNLGSVIRALSSNAVLENIQDITAPTDTLTLGRDETYAVQGDDEDRMSAWRSLIRQEFARKKSVVIYVPTLEDMRNLNAALIKGIGNYIFTLHGELTAKKILFTWEAIAKSDHPVVIIAMGSFMNLPRTDIETVIIERENGRGWINQASPYLDIRHAIETISRKQKRAVYIADSLLRVETLCRLENHEIAEGSPFKWKSISTAKDELIDMKVEATEILVEKKKKHFRVLSSQLENLIRQNHNENSHLFIMVARRGLSSLTVCDDCETIVACKECSAPTVLHASKETGRNFFMCHNCGARRSADEMCVNCGGWRLTPLGIGTERVTEEICKLFPKLDIINIDADNTKTEKQIATAIQKFRAKPGSIMVGTEMALLHLGEPVEHVAVASIDSLLALPDFRIQERMMYALVRLRNLAKRTFMVQTRRAEEKVFEYGMKGNLGDFYRSVIHDRKQFSYPPFSLLIKISIEGKKSVIATEMANIRALLVSDTPSAAVPASAYEFDIFPAFTSAGRGNSIIHGLLKIKPNIWPQKALVEKLRMLPPHVSVKIDPESLL